MYVRHGKYYREKKKKERKKTVTLTEAPSAIKYPTELKEFEHLEQDV